MNSRTFVSVIALYLLSVSGPRVFSSGTTRVGTVAISHGINCWSMNRNHNNIPFALRRRNEGEKFSPVEQKDQFRNHWGSREQLLALACN